LGALIVFDLTNPNSFSSLEYWVTIVRERADEKVQIAIAGNKSDLSSKRAISKNDVETLARKLNA
jgi:GTPase SAR1 family protein